MTLTDRIAYALTLRWVNRKRRQTGDPALDDLPLGRPGDAQGCPTANGLGHRACIAQSVWSYHDLGRKGPTFLRWTPPFVTSFIKRFDRGHYPHLSLNLKQVKELESLGVPSPPGILATPGIAANAQEELTAEDLDRAIDSVLADEHRERVGTPA